MMDMPEHFARLRAEIVAPSEAMVTALVQTFEADGVLAERLMRTIRAPAAITSIEALERKFREQREFLDRQVDVIGTGDRSLVVRELGKIIGYSSRRARRRARPR